MTLEPELFPVDDIAHVYYSNFDPAYTPFLCLHALLLTPFKHFAYLLKDI